MQDRQRIFNGEAVSVRVLVRADHEQKCFQLQLDLVQTFYDQLTVLMSKDSVMNAKDILEWIGIIGVSGVIGAAGLLGLYKQLSKMMRELEPPATAVDNTEDEAVVQAGPQNKVIEAHAAEGGIVYQILGGSGHITVAPQVHQLAKWGVMYRRAIDVRMNDHRWLEDYQVGRILLNPGWRLIVDLEERVVVDESGEQVGEASYAIKRVHGVEPPPDQARLV